MSLPVLFDDERDLIASLFSSGSQGVYYDPSDFSTMFQDSAGTTPVTALGQPVGLIRDKSGRGNHAFQATTTKRPLIQQDSAGAYYLSFDGIDDALATNSIDFTAGDQVTMFAGLRSLGASTALWLEFSNTWSGNNGTFVSADPEASFGGNPVIFAARGTAVNSVSQVGYNVVTRTNPYVVSGYSSISGDLSVTKANGVTGVSGTADKGTGNFGNYPLYIGARAGTGNYFNGRLYTLAIVASDARAQEDAIDKYISSKMGGIY